ncbi:MAG TPA: UPF0182 family protein [Candidatus Saccharimonadales bacterium]|nr:UPF0182 family protein [Candidatus Saccharimonadales bacterium]
MRNGPGRGDWGNIDWSRVDLPGLRRTRGPRRPANRLTTIITIVLVALFLIPLVFAPLVGFLTDLLWFRSLGLDAVFLRRYTAGFWAFIVFLIAFFLIALPNLYFALRPQVPRLVVDSDARKRTGAFALTLRLAPVLLVPAFFFGLAGGDEWDPLLRWLNGVPFGTTDPVFGRDIGFYFFTLPVLEFVRGWLLAAVILIAIGVVALYIVRGVIGVATQPLAGADIGVSARNALALARPARAHLSILGGVFLALIAFGYVLDQFDLLFRDETVLTGAGYTSINARLPALEILTVVVAIAAIAMFANAFFRTLWVLAGTLGLWLVASILLLGVYPSLIDRFVVTPDQLNKERPYIARNIDATRQAYSLTNVDESSADVANDPLESDVRTEFADTTSVRLWDYRPLLAAYQQLQALRQYYAFNDVDVDRYIIDGKETPVMLSARELATNQLPVAAQTWVNKHLYYTHGFGAVMTPMGSVGIEGRPGFVLQDIPPVGQPKIDQPRIYYGELTNDYAIVGTSQDEFDYAQQPNDATTRFSGGGGIGVSSLWDRLLFAIRFGDLNLLISTQLSSSSRVLFHRQISEREQLIAPFLSYDPDPYLVIADGQQYWINDAYTTGTSYPYSARYGASGRTSKLDAADINYIRNSVKVVTNAYDGSITYYVVDDKDPVLRTLRNIYPQLFKPIAEMPQSLQAHLRYPEQLFTIQTQIFATYHMTDPDNFYNRNDAWRIANENFNAGASAQPIEPYYVTAQLPGSSSREFFLFVPMTPAGTQRDNMVAWMAGRADPSDYGKLRVLKLPQSRAIFGPLQIESRITADATIRQQTSLLAVGGGATVIYGNLIVLPVGNSFLYVEPLFVQANNNTFPELQRVILATQDKIAMSDSFPNALNALFGSAPIVTQPGPSPTPTPGPSATPGASATPVPSPSAATIAQLVKSASDHYANAQAALKNGDFTTYGQELRALESDLARLRALTGQ